MPNATVDDQDIRCEFGGNWNFFRGESGPKNASGWYGQTYASCGGPGYWEQGKDCELRVPFVGTYAALFGDSNGDHGPFSCRLERDGQPVGVWAWYDGGSRWWWPYQHDTKLCEVSGLPNASYDLVLHVEVDQVKKGIAFDYMRSSDTVPPGNTTQWRSDFNDVVPPNNLRDTTATPMLPSATASLAPAPSATSASSGKSVNKLAVGLGAGLGGFFLILAVVAIVLFLRLRGKPFRRRHDPIASYDAGSTWSPDVYNSPDGTYRNNPLEPPGTWKEGKKELDFALMSPSEAGSPTFDYPTHGGLQMAFDSPPRPFSHPASSTYATSYPPSCAPLLAPAPLATSSPSETRRASAVSSVTAYSDPHRISTLLDLPPHAELDDPDTFKNVKQHSRDALADGWTALKGTGSLLQTKSGRDTVGKDLSKTSKRLTAQVKHAYDGLVRKWEEKHPTGSPGVPTQRPPVFKSEQQAIAAKSLGRSRGAYGSNAAGREYASRVRY
ncbi:4Fe-4S ferredoxin [Rhodotorula toruloides ATCC 204091]|uniref:4Fe-4S ferredoxin n=1 Tax=Rhodotorula toruloides TaxID=5286 RepID=A0A0K3CCS7_RHOTO|nr:4Fe-4S ferredoxin [Rhodotorula toruloides ATCC 204091]PRQ74519.1 4Fe-4S ferredoxin [Rhodotorula toruloides]